MQEAPSQNRRTFGHRKWSTSQPKGPSVLNCITLSIDRWHTASSIHTYGRLSWSSRRQLCNVHAWSRSRCFSAEVSRLPILITSQKLTCVAVRILAYSTTAGDLQKCKVSFGSSDWSDLPTLWNVVDGLKSLKLGEVREAAFQNIVGASDCSKNARVEW